MTHQLPNGEIDGFDPMENSQLRPLRGGDSIEPLSDMRPRAFAKLGETGIPCSGVRQPPEVTRPRIGCGKCFFALRGERVVGTITLYRPDVVSESRSSRDERVASAGPLGVDS